MRRRRKKTVAQIVAEQERVHFEPKQRKLHAVVMWAEAERRGKLGLV